MTLRNALVLLVLGLLSGCQSEDWIVIDKQGRADTMFWGIVRNFDGMPTDAVEFSLNPAGRTAFTVTSPPRVIEMKDLSVTGWIGPAAERDCGFDCTPREGDQVLQLQHMNWPFVFHFEFE